MAAKSNPADESRPEPKPVTKPATPKPPRSKAKSSSTAHDPYIADSASPPELTWSAVLLGAILGIVFSASSMYLVLKVGLTVSASIPVAVLSITLFRALSRAFGIRRATILENNIVQTTGSAGESIAFGIGVTLPALMLLGTDMHVIRIMTVGVLGGLLGILMMIPLRRAFIVKQHGVLTYPEGTACAEVLIAGEVGGATAKAVFVGFGLAFVHRFCTLALKLWQEAPSLNLFTKSGQGLKGGVLAGELTPELLGVGYIIGPRIASIMLAGGVLSALVLVPMIVLFGGGATSPVAPEQVKLIADMDSTALHKAYVLYIGAGAVATGGIISMLQALPLIFGSIRSGLRDMRAARAAGEEAKAAVPRTERDLSLWFVLLGSIALIVALMAVPSFGLGLNEHGLVGAGLIVLFGFLFVTVSSRLTGEIGSSSNPISGMTVATLLFTCLVFLLLGKTDKASTITALTVAAIVCIAASNGGTTAQDLKTGYLVGATPRSQQVSILIGALTSALVIGVTLLLLNEAGTVYSKLPENLPRYRVPIDEVQQLTFVEQAGGQYSGDRTEYRVLKLDAAQAAALSAQPGKYLVDRTGEVRYFVSPPGGPLTRRDDGQQDGGTIYSSLPANLPVYRMSAADLDKLTTREHTGGQYVDDKTEYRVLNLNSTEAEAIGTQQGKYLIADDGVVRYLVDPAINGRLTKRDDGALVTNKFEAPKTRLMALIIDGILNQRLPWGLVLIGVLIAITLELAGVPSLPFAVGVYLPISASVPIFVGGAVRWIVDKRRGANADEADNSPGTLLSSGYIAGGAIAAVIVAFFSFAPAKFNETLDLSKYTGDVWNASNWPSLAAFGLLVVFLALVGLGKILKTDEEGPGTRG